MTPRQTLTGSPTLANANLKTPEKIPRISLKNPTTSVRKKKISRELPLPAVKQSSHTAAATQRKGPRLVSASLDKTQWLRNSKNQSGNIGACNGYGSDKAARSRQHGPGLAQSSPRTSRFCLITQANRSGGSSREALRPPGSPGCPGLGHSPAALLGGSWVAAGSSGSSSRAAGTAGWCPLPPRARLLSRSRASAAVQRGLDLAPLLTRDGARELPPDTEPDPAGCHRDRLHPRNSLRPRLAPLSSSLPQDKLTVPWASTAGLHGKGTGETRPTSLQLSGPPLPLPSPAAQKRSGFLACIASNSEQPPGTHQLSGCQRNMENM